MKSKPFIPGKLRDQNGAVLVLVAILFAFVFIVLMAFAIDIGHLTVVRNELQNAADAGALAGATVLYHDNGGTKEVNTEANQTAYNTATQNQSDHVAVEVYNPTTNQDDVQRGHWNPDTRTFTRSDSTEAVSLLNVDTHDLNKMDGTFEYPALSGKYPILINAVQVKTSRGNASVPDNTPVTAFFAQIFGIDSFVSSAEAIAWLGYGSYIIHDKLDLPLALCQETLQTDGEYDCNIGRRINSGLPQDDVSSYNTGGWTDFHQVEDLNACPGSASSSEVSSIFACGEPANEYDIDIPKRISANGGEITAVYGEIVKCWQDYADAGTSWSVVLPVVICEGQNVGVCPVAISAIRVNIVFVSSVGTPKPDKDSPTVMDDWNYTTNSTCDPYKTQIGKKNMAEAITALKAQDTIYNNMPDSVIADRWPGESDYSAGIARWDCFTDYFQLRNADGNYAPLDKKSIYFKPECSLPEDAIDGMGSTNTGVFSEHPVLVQ